MRATEFIRDLLDLIDNIDSKEDGQLDFADEISNDCGCGDNCECPTCQSQLQNSPDTFVTPVDTILSMGNDLNKPKHPADLRVSTVALYPDTAFKG